MILVSFNTNNSALLIQGVNVKAPWKGSPDATNTISGTSMAAPHVVSISILWF